MAKKSVKKPAKKVTAGKSARKFVYSFGGGKADGNRSMKDTLGGKGAGLAEMTNAGLPVPAGFTISTDACNIYYANNSRLPQNIETEMVAALRKQGARDVMVYDEDGRLRIQALGAQPARLVR